jgi:hypothetical protein
MPGRNLKPLHEMTDRELVASAWAFGTLGSLIGIAWSWHLIRPDPEPLNLPWRIVWGLVPIVPFILAAGGVRRYTRELRRRRSERARTASQYE